MDCQQCGNVLPIPEFAPIVKLTTVDNLKSVDPYIIQVWIKCPSCGVILIGYQSHFRRKEHRDYIVSQMKKSMK